MKTYTLIALMFLACSAGYAQQPQRPDSPSQRAVPKEVRDAIDQSASKQAGSKIKDAREKYSKTVREGHENFAKTVEEANKRFLQTLGLPWEEFGVEPSLPVPKSPDPDIPPQCPDLPDVVIDDDPLVLPEEDIILPEDRPDVTPLIIPEGAPAPKTARLNFYGSVLSVPYEPSMQLSLPAAVNEQQVADAWRQCSDGRCYASLNALQQARSELELSDWPYLKMVEAFAEVLVPAGNSRTFLQFFLLTQSGYNMRLGYDNSNRLIALYPIDGVVYGHPSVTLGGRQYYLLSSSNASASFYVHNQAFPGEQTMSMNMRQPKLAKDPAPERTVSSSRYPDVSATVAINRNLMVLMQDYPYIRWNHYSASSLSRELKAALYPVLRQAVAGKDEHEAANVLINFVQTGFEYATDDDQFGYERPLFGDETFYYPYSDCEDRAILYSILVRELLDLDVVLLHYPGHLATAVKFKGRVPGDALIVDGERYIVCDPTYIGAPVGCTMPQYAGCSDIRVVRVD